MGKTAVIVRTPLRCRGGECGWHNEGDDAPGAGLGRDAFVLTTYGTAWLNAG
ncbi:hypothetical protein [Streptomyces coffeae]|uniref:Uncharacterized protein n=1 Tax=Streptomyces coffeae TaxID=621382 RepID=A0ABS1NQP7_9ACTN|nr:hypothetical protein [Streptomyces coffeae]MBL1102086.1 hypothetical protein [Streptomyces coffeae]